LIRSWIDAGRRARVAGDHDHQVAGRRCERPRPGIEGLSFDAARFSQSRPRGGRVALRSLPSHAADVKGADMAERSEDLRDPAGAVFREELDAAISAMLDGLHFERPDRQLKLWVLHQQPAAED
jgi:hypothetical protein